MFHKLLELGVSKVVLITAGVAIVAGVGSMLYYTSNARQTVITLPTPVPSVSSSQAATQSPSTAPTITTITKKSTPQVTQTARAANPSPSPSSVAQASTTPVDSNQPPLLLKGLGIDLGYYDPATGRAGDIVFTKDRLQFDILFTEYGFTIPASMSASGQPKRNPQPTWMVPMGTKVRSIVDGVVTNVSTLYSNDFSIMVATDAKSQWQYETEHVTNPLVKVGDRVTAGQVIAEVSPHNKDGNSGYGMVEIGILKGGNPPQHICPFDYFDSSVKEELQKKLAAFYAAWEEYRGSTSLHDEAAQQPIGCSTLDAIDG